MMSLIEYGQRFACWIHTVSGTGEDLHDFICKG